VISVESIEFRYGSQAEELFGGLDYEFSSGSVSVVTGPSGRGKSTLLYLLGLLLTPSSGVVRIDGTAGNLLSDSERSRLRAARIGFVFQDAALDPTRSVLDNVAEGGLYAGLQRPEANERARVLLDRLAVILRDDHKPGEVSGGQAQRVGLCRALIKNPQLILADEPTGNLDIDSADVVLDELSDAATKGATVVIASHDPRILDRSDRVLAL
jgi:putative ABC transport system ATP-binding protein/lipoprotein-releasing system ATP-binding protein